MRSSFAILCVWICFSVGASTQNGCSEIPEEENAEVSQSSRKDNYSDGDKLDYNCKHGYASPLKITYICRDNNWTKSHDGKCSQATCPLNTTVEDLKIERSPDIEGPVEHGHKIIFSCNGQGLILKGQREITCQPNGEWSSPFPKCEEVMCVANLTVHMRSDFTEDGHPGPEVSIRPGHTITLSCVGKGTKLQGQKKISCLSTGEWNVPFPKCVRGCSEIPEEENAEVSQSSRKDNYSDGDKLDYNCKHGYASPQKITYMCSNNKWTKWRGEKCSQATCPLNTTVEDLKIERSPDIEGPIEHGHKLRFSCNGQRLILKGQREITCQPSGEWSSPFPKCEEVMCVANLTVNMRSDGHPGPEVSIRPGHTITLSCVEKGSELQGQKKISCLSTGEWNVPFPKCVRGCSEIPEEENAEVSQISKKDNYSDGDKLDYNCKHGYASPLKITYMCSNNKWTKLRDAKCSLKRCELPEDIPNGRYTIVSGTKFVFGTTIKYICRDGYQMMSRFDTRTCRDGGWDNQIPACEEISCVPDKTEGNMRVEGLPDYDELIKYGHRLTFSCVAQILQGPKEITCLSNGQWSSPFPKCVEATCSLNTKVEDLKMERYPDIEGPVKSGHKLIFSCNGQGLILKGQSEITCQPNGEWSSRFPKCEEVMCVANMPLNMRSDGRPGPEVSIRPGHTITLSCVGKGTKLQGRSKISCLSTAEWNYPFPKCVRGKCERPPQVEFADTTGMTKPEYNLGERVEYICFNKYTLVQRRPYSKYMTCEQGEWRGRIKCLKPCSVTVEVMDKRGIQLKWRPQEKIFSPHEDRIEFACKRGKYLIGSIPLKQICNDGEMNLPECV